MKLKPAPKCYGRGKLIKSIGCCCFCKHHLPFFGHPWVDGNSIKTQLGWLCCGPEFMEGHGPMISHEHGAGCELYEPKKKEPK